MASPSPAQAGLRCIIIGGTRGAGAKVGNQGGGTISTRIVSHDHGSFTGFLFVVGTLRAEPGCTRLRAEFAGPSEARVTTFFRRPQHASPLLISMVGMRSYRRGSAAAMGRGLRGQ